MPDAPEELCPLHDVIMDDGVCSCCLADHEWAENAEWAE